MRIYRNFSEEQLQLLRDRAVQVAKSLDSGEMEQPITVLGITLHGENYLLPGDGMSAVYEDVHIVPIPNAPSYVQGIANIRGHIMLIADLARILGIPGSASVPEQVSVVVLHSDLDIAFLVESITGLETLSASSIDDDLPNTLTNKVYLDGLAPDGRALLHINSILADLVEMAS